MVWFSLLLKKKKLKKKTLLIKTTQRSDVEEISISNYICKSDLFAFLINQTIAKIKIEERSYYVPQKTVIVSGSILLSFLWCKSL